MTWLSLLRRAWAVWKLRKKIFHLCKDCTYPLTFEESAKDGQGYQEIWLCDDCKDIRLVARNRQIEEARAQQGYLVPGLRSLFAKAQQQSVMILGSQNNEINPDYMQQQLINQQQYLQQQELQRLFHLGKRKKQ